MKAIQKNMISPRRLIFGAGLLLTAMELAKQTYLYAVVFGGHYNVWYFPFQLCSVPMYLALLWPLLEKRRERLAMAAATFIQDFGLLGGVAALIVHEGFTHPGHPMLTAHGYIWHILLIAMSIYMFRSGFAGQDIRSFRDSAGIFAVCAVIAEIINVLLHPFGDCDMFYISPYHLSSQIVFRDIDRIIGRGPGIIFYLLCVVAGAALVHLAYGRIRKYAETANIS